MDDNCLRGLYDGCSQEDRQLVLQYFDHLRTSTEGWKICATDFSERIHKDDHARFFCLQVLEHHVRTRHALNNAEDILTMRKVLLLWLQPPQDGVSDKPFIKNKMAQIIALTFVNDYPAKWPSFFMDILSIIEHDASIWTVDLYLRTLLAIDDEIMDREVVHTQEDNLRNAVIKDHMRDTCVSELVESWFQILTTYEEIDHEVMSLTMDVIGHYVSWMDIKLIANDRFISLLLKYFCIVTLRESAAECLHDILSKGMEPLAKLQLIETLVKVLESSQILTSARNEDDDDDIEFQIKMSKLVNGIGMGLLTTYNKLLKLGDQESSHICLSAIESKLPYMLRFLNDEDDGVSENVITFATNYVIILKHQTNLSEDKKQNIQTLLYGVISKLKYDESYNFTNQGEDEALFIEYRSRLKVLFDNIAQLDPSLTISVVQTLLSSTLANLENESFMNIELALQVFYYIGDNYFEKLFGSAGNPETPFYQMMSLIINSQVSLHTHMAVILQYYDVITRHDKFFISCTQYIPSVLTGFLDHRGLRNENPSVRSRLCYKFLQFIKSVRNHISDLAEDMLQCLQDLLLMMPGTSDNVGLITSNDLLFLYEAAGFLVVYSARPPEGKSELMRFLLSPLLEKFNLFLPELYRAQTLTQQEDIAQTLYLLLSYSSRTSKVFPNHHTAKLSGCLPCFEEALPVILRGLEVTIQREHLHSGVRQYLHRMIICLGDELLKYIPMAVSLLLKDCQSHDIQEFIPLINQLITKYQSKISPFLQEVFVPVVDNIITCLNKPYDPQDTEELRDRVNLQKSYYLFINSLAVNEVTCVIASQGSNHLQDVLRTIVQGAKNSEPAIQKMCFQTLKKFVEAWGSDGKLEGFVDYSYKEILPVCFIAPIQIFDMNDAQAFLAIGEIAGVMKAMINCRGNEFLLYLQNQYLPSIHVQPDVTQELLVKLQESDIKSLKPYLKALFMKLRTPQI